MNVSVLGLRANEVSRASGYVSTHGVSLEGSTYSIFLLYFRGNAYLCILEEQLEVAFAGCTCPMYVCLVWFLQTGVWH